MIWAILAAVGVPLWLCAIAIAVLLFRNRTLRKRYGDLPVRFRAKPNGGWRRGHGIWVNDVFGFRGSPAAWSEDLLWVATASFHSASDDEAKKLHRLGENPVVVELGLARGDGVAIAGKAEDGGRLLGPFVPSSDVTRRHSAAAEHDSGERSSSTGHGESTCVDAPLGAGPTA